MEQALHDRLTGWRRHLHRHPELSLHEHETARFVAARLDELGIPHVDGVGGNGIVATIARGASNRSVGLRADMDALPITETTGLPYASSNPGAMHACGHDGHTVSLLGAAALLLADSAWSGTVQLVFQPAEEGYGGAQSMLADGLLERFPMERIFGYHNWPGLEAGTVAIHDGACMAGGARVYITLRGLAGHAAMPHLTRDPMVAAGHLIVALQSVVSRNVDPLETAVISIGMVEGGVAPNQICDAVTLKGTHRTFKPAVREAVDDGIHRVVAGIAATFGMTAEVDITPGIGPVVNQHDCAVLVAEAAADAGLALRRDLPPSMASEDFGWYMAERPSAFLWIGNGPGDGGRGLHNPNYDFNDAILPAAATALASTAKRALRAG